MFCFIYNTVDNRAKHLAFVPNILDIITKEFHIYVCSTRPFLQNGEQFNKNNIFYIAPLQEGKKHQFLVNSIFNNSVNNKDEMLLTTISLLDKKFTQIFNNVENKLSIADIEYYRNINNTSKISYFKNNKDIEHFRHFNDLFLDRPIFLYDKNCYGNILENNIKIQNIIDKLFNNNDFHRIWNNERDFKINDRIVYAKDVMLSFDDLTCNFTLSTDSISNDLKDFNKYVIENKNITNSLLTHDYECLIPYNIEKINLGNLNNIISNFYY